MTLNAKRPPPAQGRPLRGGADLEGSARREIYAPGEHPARTVLRPICDEAGRFQGLEAVHG
jgi:hypothetical protein